jgi:phage-related protein
MIEVTVNGVTFSSLGLGVKRHDIPVLPPTKDYNVEIAGMDGEIDFGSTYGPRPINIDCVLMADDSTVGYHYMVAAIATTFNAKRGDLVFTFSDLAGRRYMARYCGTMPIEKLIFDGNVTIPLKMHWPFPESLRDTSVIEYNQGLEYGQGYDYSSYAAQVTFSSQSINIENLGTVESAPLIRITGSFTNLSLSDGTNTSTYSGTTISTDVIEINCKKSTITKNGVNTYAQSNGVFFLLKPGMTNIVSTSTNPIFKIEFIFRHNYLY